MKKKVCTIVLALAAAVCLALGLSACTQTHTHTFAEEWTSDETGHWHEATCGDTEEKGDFASHLYVNGECYFCGYEHEEHSYGEYLRDETIHSHTCTVCHKVETGTHNYVNGVCSDCKYEHIAHSFGAYETDENEHSRTCSVCGKVESDTHDYANGVCGTCNYTHIHHDYAYRDAESTESEHSGACAVCGKAVTGSHDYENGVCKDCGYEHKNHSFEAYIKNEEGHSHACSVCHKVESDGHSYENGSCRTCGYEHQNHSFGEYEIDKDGHSRTCEDCGKIESDEHTYSEGVCEVCDYEHEEHQFGDYDKTTTDHTRTCTVCKKSETGSHVYSDGACTVCQYEHQSHTFGGLTCDVCGKKLTYMINSTKMTFGKYPQTEVTDENDSDESLRHSLNMAAGEVPTSTDFGQWTSYKYFDDFNIGDFMFYQDIDYQGERYRGVYKIEDRSCISAKYNSSSWQTGSYENGYFPKQTYWFRFDPIRWRVLEQKNGSVFLSSDCILDSQPYSKLRNDPTGAVDLLGWLDDTFYQTAFDESEQSSILTSQVKTPIGTSRERIDARKIFLLSVDELVGLMNAYPYPYTLGDMRRQCYATDYSVMQGLRAETDSRGIVYGPYWLRDLGSGGPSGQELRSVDFDGKIHERTPTIVYCTYYGVVPALWIKL